MTDESILGKEDQYIFSEMETFARSEEVSHITEIKQLIVHIEQAVSFHHLQRRYVPN